MSGYRVEKADGVWTFMIDRPEARNALTWPVRYALLDTVVQAEQHGSGCGAIVITAAGDKAFCAGGDVSVFAEEMATIEERWPTEMMAQMRAIGDMVKRICTSPVPIVSAVNGAAFGGGTFLALAADIVIAHKRAKFGFGFTQRGLVPDWGGFYVLPRLVGMARAKNLVLRGLTLGADDALAAGLIAEVVDGDVRAHATDIARELASGPRVALTIAKQVLGRSFETGMEGMLLYEILGQTIARGTDDHLEGIKSFLEKRPAVFAGK